MIAGDKIKCKTSVGYYTLTEGKVYECLYGLEDGIFELRAQAGNNISRVLYFFMLGNQAVLTHGFIKKTQKTPAREIKRAKKMRDEYVNRSRR